MKEYAKKPENASRTLDSNPKASKQASISQILQRYKDRTEGKPVQRQSINEEELLQAKVAQQDHIKAVLQRYSERNIQRYASEEDEELIQGKFDTAQREEIDEDEILQGKFESDTQSEQEPIQREEKPNNTGLPDNLKTDIENLSGYSMDDVKVHYNSDKPAQLNALAYAQGTDIHVAPGQEKHLPHEAWHVVQQKQGRVQPTMQLQGVNVNDNEGLEKEADVMGGKSINFDKESKNRRIISKQINNQFIQCGKRKKGTVPDSRAFHVDLDFYLEEHGFPFSKNISDDYINLVAAALITAKELIKNTISILYRPLSEDNLLAFKWNFSNTSIDTISIVINYYTHILSGLNTNGLVLEDKLPFIAKDKEIKGYVASPGFARTLFGSNIHFDFTIEDQGTLAYLLIHEASHAFTNTNDIIYLSEVWNRYTEAKKMDDIMYTQVGEEYVRRDFSYENVEREFSPGVGDTRANTNNADSYAVFAFFVNGKKDTVQKIV